ncbi:MAG: hypothetical protein IT365_11345 [Candidatus Hydrogenedentes bacterium]|nr:hypothetical protein [Candidatus Hydrogenedentota bacterium]
MLFEAPGASTAQVDVDGWLPQQVAVLDGVGSYTLNTALLKAGDYLIRVIANGADGKALAFSIPVTVAREHDSERVPVWRWGGGGGNAEWWQARGFTGAFIFSPKDPVEPDAPIIAQYRNAFENATRLDFDLGLYFRTLDSEELRMNEASRILRPDGTRGEDPYPLDPIAIAHAETVTEQSMNLWGSYPGLRHVMYNSEWQTPYCLNDAAIKDAQEEAGIDLHNVFNAKGSIVPLDPDAVQAGVVADDNLLYRFYQWWWQRGHGTAPMNEAQNAIVKRHRPDVITWHEPYRLAPVRNAAKGLDCIGTWTYGHPDIKRLCYTTYLQAAARPESQLVQQDITLFVYGSFVIPIGDSTSDFSQDFAGKDPYFTAGPDYAREATWLVMSQRPDILCYYSAGALSPDNPMLDPTYSSPETFDAIGQACDELVKPFGPALRASRRTPPETAVLMSAAATWFPEAPHLPGYPNEQTLPFATLLMMNHVPFDVLLDEDVVEGALERYKLLVLPRAGTLTHGVYERLVAFAQAGGRVIADTSLRAEVPEVQRVNFDFTPQEKVDGKALARGEALTAEEMRVMMENYAADLAPLLDGITKPASADSPRVLTNSLDAGAVRYHFFINDDRAYGPRFGQWKLSFELGVPQTARLSVAAAERPVLYDMLQRSRIEYETQADRAVFTSRLPAARGRLVAALPEALSGVRVTAPAECKAGEIVELMIEVLGVSGNPISGALPLRVDVADPRARDSEWSRYTTTRDGRCTFRFIPAMNDMPGTWTVSVTELIGGYKQEHKVSCAASAQ